MAGVRARAVRRQRVFRWIVVTVLGIFFLLLTFVLILRPRTVLWAARKLRSSS